MILNFRRLIILVFVAWPGMAAADFMGGIELKTTHYDNFNLAYGSWTPLSERVNSVEGNLTWYKASSRDVVWLLKGIYGYEQFDRYDYLTGSIITLMGGMFYRFNQTNSVTLEIGEREKRYDSKDLYLYEDDAHLINMKFSHRLSPTLLLNEKLVDEENDPHFAENKYRSYGGQLWLEWNIGDSSVLAAGYTATKRTYTSTDSTYTFAEPYMYYGYSISRHWYTRLGTSKIRVSDDAGNKAYNKTAYLAIGCGF